MKPETPTLAMTTAVVRKCELFPISLRMENICLQSAISEQWEVAYSKRVHFDDMCRRKR